MKSLQAGRQLSFQSKLERIATEAEYYALSVPAKVSQKLGTRAAVPITARINHSKPFRGSLFPVGGGRHYMRVKAEVRKEAKIKGGDRVRVQITVVDRSGEISIPKDLAGALRAEGVLKEFRALPPGKKSYIIRRIDEAAKPETREKRIQDAVKAAREKGEKRVERT